MRTLISLLPWLSGGILLATWSKQSAGLAHVHGLAVFLWLLAGVPLVYALRRDISGVLRWDGQQWSWESGPSRLVGRAMRRLDWQGALLLEFCPMEGRSLWLWTERRKDPLRWDDLRRALEASRSTEVHPADDGAQR